jgi:hypothetical protein
VGDGRDGEPGDDEDGDRNRQPSTGDGCHGGN